ncbi:MAG: HD domain-containing protein [Clostridiales bacterium]|nr:HD domain-containing protein [Clostridiales bacterium]
MISEKGLDLNESDAFNEICKEDLEEAITHGILVSNLAFRLATELKLSKAKCHELAEAGMVHDIGKLRLGEYLYGRKNDTLKIEEMKYVRLHPKLGYDILVKEATYSDEILNCIYHHHENFDGSGYPDNLVGKAIPYGARILRTCDVFAALVTERPYRAAFEIDQAIELMIDEVKNFDMKIFLTFLEMVNDKKFDDIKRYIYEVNHKEIKLSAV